MVVETAEEIKTGTGACWCYFAAQELGISVFRI